LSTKLRYRAFSSPSFYFLDDPANWPRLETGHSVFTFACRTGGKFTDADRMMASSIINLSSFASEEVDNLVPYINVGDDEDIRQYTVVMIKAMYILRGVTVDDLGPDLLASREFQKACQPGSPKIWDDVTDPHVFRMTKPIIPLIFSITVQFQASEITDPAVRKTLSANIDHLEPCTRCLLLERTKRNKEHIDSTAKVKSVLMYHPIQSGILVSHLSVVCNTSIPQVAAAVLQNLGTLANSEIAETSYRTRRYFRRKLGFEEDPKDAKKQKKPKKEKATKESKKAKAEAEKKAFAVPKKASASPVVGSPVDAMPPPSPEDDSETESDTDSEGQSLPSAGSGSPL